jgi:hypothetical protein
VISRRTSRALLPECTIFVDLAFLLSFASAADILPSIWKKWDHAAKLQCPSLYLELLGNVYDGLIGDFVRALPRDNRPSIDAIADYSQRCREETAGFSCDMAVYVDAFSKLGLLKKFAAFSCDRYKCLEAAYCVDLHTNKLR